MEDLSQLDQRRERAARNQNLFREVNERINELMPQSTFQLFVCECELCKESIPMTIQEYEQVRLDPNCFFVLPGHEVPSVEVVTESTSRYVLVSKLGAGSELAEELDPRGDGFAAGSSVAP
jgi:hypothetical protein